MTSPGIDMCSLVPLYIEPHFGEVCLGRATGFLWLAASGRLALVTNWHVAAGRNHETEECLHVMGGVPDHLRVHVPRIERRDAPLVVEVSTINDEGAPLWTEHPKFGRGVDVVALPITLPPPNEAAYLPMNALPSAPLKQRIGMPLFILGFPFGRLGVGMPVWKQASFASEPFLAPDHDHRFLIVDTASRPGMSGSPAIQRHHGQIELEDDKFGRISDGDGATRFGGVYSGRFHTSDASDAQLGRVWPASLVTDIVDHMIDGGHV
ncbi:trypsin-like peptidase domain-containing protein [Caulobacter sp. UNC279MFTsu5.1]|uniref:trypsin-like peptidase domain-containing protein n=1 Tax=Caulobacter sp. UNC279MFTsu5.1 TaxID=1502775 RepID=UPI0008E013B2|nr:trypsin-like peptidase domain-containing protein [Caulobacter sp. UNC279MFTsu5.1]SFK70575.1 Trypsin-like peptidase domain-containing protein [Caulobacter sp. UNC279MFTsu5.1]